MLCTILVPVKCQQLPQNHETSRRRRRRRRRRHFDRRRPRPLGHAHKCCPSSGCVCVWVLGHVFISKAIIKCRSSCCLCLSLCPRCLGFEVVRICAQCQRRIAASAYLNLLLLLLMLSSTLAAYSRTPPHTHTNTHKKAHHMSQLPH